MELTIVHAPQRRVFIMRGKSAEDYFAYCEEVGCDIWERLLEMEGRDGEPVCFWLPENMIVPGTSRYVQGVVVGEDYAGRIPEGFDEITIPEGDYLQFRGAPFVEEKFGEAIGEVWAAMADFDPASMGCMWDESRPRIQLEPRCERGYMELKAVRNVKH